MTPNQILPDSDISAENIKAIYAFVPTVQKYAQLYPPPAESSKDLEILRSIDDDELIQMAFWVYSDKSENKLSYVPLEIPSPFNSRKLYRGWNFVGVTLDMIQNPTYPQLTFNDIKGNCNVEKTYVFVGGQWYKLDPLPPLDDILSGGIVVKVSNDCQLGMESAALPLPPSIP